MGIFGSRTVHRLLLGGTGIQCRALSDLQVGVFPIGALVIQDCCRLADYGYEEAREIYRAFSETPRGRDRSIFCLIFVPAEILAYCGSEGS